jgi:hypothetical protein
MDNKELIVVGSCFGLIIALAMYMFVSQQKETASVKKSAEIWAVVLEMQKKDAELEARIDSLEVRFNETDAKYHKGAE